MAAVVIADKYHLKSIHEEIGLFDRKLAHLLKYEKFDTTGEREEAARKLTVKRATLVQTALRLVAEGVEFKPRDLPRSMRPNDEPDPVVTIPEIAAPVESVEAPAANLSSHRRTSAPYTGTSLDWQASVRQYMEKKGKA